MSTIEKGRADHIQRIADEAIAEARNWSGWYWSVPSKDEAEVLLDGQLSKTLGHEVSRLSDDERAALIDALLPLFAAEYENQQAVIEDLALHTAEAHTVAELETLLRSENLTPPERYDYEVALRIREHAEENTLEVLEALSHFESSTPAEVAMYKDAKTVRRKLYAKRRNAKPIATSLA